VAAAAVEKAAGVKAVPQPPTTTIATLRGGNGCCDSLQLEDEPIGE